MINTSLSLIDLSLGEIIGGPSEKLKKFTSSKVLEDWQGYTNPYGIYELRRLLSRHFQPLYNKELKVSQVLVTAGASMGLSAFYHLFSNQRLLIPNVCFPLYRKTAKQYGIELIEYYIGPHKDWEQTLEQIEKEFINGAKAIIWNNPNNPFGYIAPNYVVEKLCELCEKYKVLCVSDEVYRDFTRDTNITSPSELIPNQTIFIYSLSKSYGIAGIRIGCVIAHPKIIENLREIHWNLGMSTSWIGQEIAKYAIEYLNDYPEKLSKKITNRLNGAAEFFSTKNIPFYSPDGGIYVCIDTKELGIDAVKFTDLARQKMNLQLMPGTAFGNTSSHIVRLNAGVEDAKFFEALHRIEQIYSNVNNL
ncbi:pyridoxal phosphate-dependent aminotransferase [Bacillus sp. Bos-x628]|uniref:pyridoxal phosphate-dependent aminotransferase n=1 Tax=Bacillus maqinnsis TaxID=3229854 RepID=UPI00338D6F95